MGIAVGESVKGRETRIDCWMSLEWRAGDHQQRKTAGTFMPVRLSISDTILFLNISRVLLSVFLLSHVHDARTRRHRLPGGPMTSSEILA